MRRGPRLSERRSHIGQQTATGSATLADWCPSPPIVGHRERCGRLPEPRRSNAHAPDPTGRSAIPRNGRPRFPSPSPWPQKAHKRTGDSRDLVTLPGPLVYGPRFLTAAVTPTPAAPAAPITPSDAAGVTELSVGRTSSRGGRFVASAVTVGLWIHVIAGDEISDDRTDLLGVPIWNRDVYDIESRDRFVCGPPAFLEALTRRSRYSESLVKRSTPSGSSARSNRRSMDQS
jgi:hypothetical protein